MTQEQLNEIRTRGEGVAGTAKHFGFASPHVESSISILVLQDIPALLEEIESLTEIIDTLKSDMDTSENDYDMLTEYTRGVEAERNDWERKAKTLERRANV